MTPYPLNIAMVAACPFPTSQGSQVLIRELSEALVHRGHRVHVVTYHFGQKQPCRGFFIHRIPEVFRYNKFRSGPEIRKPLLDLLLMRKLYQVVRQENIHIIHAHNYEAPLAAFPVRFLRKIPVVYHSHNTMSDEFYTYFRLKIPQILARGAAHLMDRFIPRHADFIIAINRRVAEFLSEMGTPAQKIKYIPPGIDFRDAGYANPGLRDRLDLGDGPLILYIGNLDGYQRLDLLLAALPQVFSQHPEAKLVILTGSPAAALQADIDHRRLTEHVVVVQDSSFGMAKELMALGAVAVNPRISWSGFPIKLLNYMAAGLPIVAFRGAAAPVVQGINGLLTPPGDVCAFAAAINSLLDNPFRCQAMRQEALRMIHQEYNWGAICSKIERIYFRLLGLPLIMPEAVDFESELSGAIISNLQNTQLSA